MQSTTEQQWSLADLSGLMPTSRQIGLAQSLLASRIVDLSDPVTMNGLRGHWDRMNRNQVARLIQSLKAARPNDV